MPFTSIPASIAEQRQHEFLDDAERHRLAREARPTAVPLWQSVLHNALIRIRPIRPTDTGLLEEAFSRLSPQSRQMRFLFPKMRLSPAELRYFTDVDHHDHEAVVALHRLEGRGLGVARFIRHRNDPQAADVAVTVIDEWQGRGLGARLATRLMERARCEGITRFTAEIASDNARARKLLYAVGDAPMLQGYDDGVASYDISLGPGAARAAVPRLLRVGRAGCSCA